jgi:hypothetical protein
MSVDRNSGHNAQTCPSLLNPEQTGGKNWKVYLLHGPKSASLNRIHVTEVLVVHPVLA